MHVFHIVKYISVTLTSCRKVLKEIGSVFQKIVQDDTLCAKLNVGWEVVLRK